MKVRPTAPLITSRMCGFGYGQTGMFMEGNYYPRGRGNTFFGTDHEFSELNRGPRAIRLKNQKVAGPASVISSESQKLSSLGNENSGLQFGQGTVQPARLPLASCAINSGMQAGNLSVLQRWLAVTRLLTIGSKISGLAVTNSRDAQEVELVQGLQMLKIFKEHINNTSVFDDFDFYEHRQHSMQEKRAKQQQLQKQDWDGKTSPLHVEGEKVVGKEIKLQPDAGDPVKITKGAADGEANGF